MKNCLYTNQKRKKNRTWKDGYVKMDTKKKTLTLFDETVRNIVKGKKYKYDEETEYYDTGFYLIHIDNDESLDSNEIKGIYGGRKIEEDGNEINYNAGINKTPIFQNKLLNNLDGDIEKDKKFITPIKKIKTTNINKTRLNDNMVSNKELCLQENDSSKLKSKLTNNMKIITKSDDKVTKYSSNIENLKSTENNVEEDKVISEIEEIKNIKHQKKKTGRTNKEIEDLINF